MSNEFPPTPPMPPVPPLPPGAQVAYPPNSGKAIAALVCGILGITMCGCFPISIVAWVLGSQAEQEIRASHGQLSGDGLAKAGRIMGIIGTVAGIVYLGLIVALFAFSIAVDTTTSGY
jgi:hypothetical protein